MNLRIARYVLAFAGAAIPAVATAAPAPAPAPVTPKVNPLAQPQQQVKDAQTALDNAKKQVLIIRKRVETTFVTKPEFTAAKTAMEKSKIEYDIAQRRVTTNLEKSSEYKSLLARKEKAQATLDQVSNPKPTASGEDPVKISDEEVNAAGKERTEVGLAILAMQKSVGENDAAYQASKQKYTESKTAYDALQVQVDDAVKLDPEYAPAQQAVDQADAALKQAKESLAAAIKAQQPVRPPPAPVRSSGGGYGKGG